MCSETDVFKDVNKSHKQGFFAAMRERMETASATASAQSSPLGFDERSLEPPQLVRGKSHFDHDEVGDSAVVPLDTSIVMLCFFRSSNIIRISWCPS